MLHVIVVTQGRLAHELLNSAERILGGPIRARSVCFDWEASAQEDRRLLIAALEEYPEKDRFLLLTDLPGGTPHRVASEFAGDRAAVVTGVSLPMVVRLGCLEDDDSRSPKEVAEWIADKGRQAVMTSICGERPGGS